jgi:hypothetical protein
MAMQLPRSGIILIYYDPIQIQSYLIRRSVLIFALPYRHMVTLPMMEEEIDMYGRMAVALNILESCREFAALIPEVRTNLVYARPGAKTRHEVLGIDGRITVVTASLWLRASPGSEPPATWPG